MNENVRIIIPWNRVFEGLYNECIELWYEGINVCNYNISLVISRLWKGFSYDWMQMLAHFVVLSLGQICLLNNVYVSDCTCFYFDEIFNLVQFCILFLSGSRRHYMISPLIS